MILTEEEAKTKRCQESFGPPLSAGGHVATTSYCTSYVSGGSYASIQVTSPAYCIAGACMAWRFEGATIDGTFTGYCGKAHR